MFVDHPHIHNVRVVHQKDAQGTLTRILVLETDINLPRDNTLNADRRSQQLEQHLVSYLEYLHQLKDEGFIPCHVIALRDGRGRTYVHKRSSTMMKQ